MNKTIVFSLFMIACVSMIGTSYAETQTFRDKQYESGSECEFMVINYIITPPYDLRQVQSLMLFDAGRCDAINAPDFSNGIPYYVITEIWPKSIFQ